MPGLSEDELEVVARLILTADPVALSRSGEDALMEATHGMERGAATQGQVVGSKIAAGMAAGYRAAAGKMVAAVKATQAEQDRLLESSLRQRERVLTEITQAENARRLEVQRQANREINRDRQTAATHAYVQEQQAENRKSITLRASYRQGEIESRTAANTSLQNLRHSDHLEEIESKSSHERRTALLKSFLRGSETILRSGLNASTSLWSHYLAQRREKQQAADDRQVSTERSGLERQTSVIREQLSVQNATFTRAASERLRTIERTQRSETRVVTEGAVRQAEAVAAIRKRTSSGIIGATAGGVTGGGGVLGNLLAFAGAGVILRAVQQETTQAVVANRVTAAGIKSTGAAAHVTSQQIQDLALKLGFMAGKDDQLVQGAENILLTFRSIQNTKINKTFDQATLAVLNLSARFHKDLTSSAILVGKALQDPIKGLGALRRVGVQFTTQQQDQIKYLVASGHLLEAQKIILHELSVEVGGSAAATATAGDRFKVVIKNIEQTIGLAFYGPITKALSFVSDALFKLFYGKGAWKVLRDGLEGVAIGLGAVLTVKAGVEVFALLGDALTVFAASPVAIALTAFATLSGVLFALFRNTASVRNFFTSLEVGTRNWVKVGYLIDKPIKDLSFIVRLQTSIGSAARHIKDFFVSLEVGTRNWAKVGYLVDHPIKGLSTIVLLQSSFGAAARKIVDHLGLLKTAFSDLGKFKFSQAGHILSDFVKSILGTFGPAETAIHKAISHLFQSLEGFVASAILPRIAIGRLNIGAFLLSALGIPTTGGGVVQSFIRDHIIKSITGALNIGDISKALIPRPGLLNADKVLGGFAASLQASRSATGSKLGKTFHAIVVQGLEGAAAIGVDIGAFFSSLFTGNAGGGTGAAGHRLGVKLHDLIGTAFAEVGKLASPIGDLLGKAGGGIGRFFEKVVLPGLIEIPYKIGKFLSRTVFSKAFLNTIINGVVGFAAIAATMAIQFALGFVKGLEQRRGDIANVLRRVFVFAVKTLFGSGNPFLLIAGVLLAVFAGAKIKGAFDALRGQFHVASRAMAGDLEGAKQASADLKTEVTKIRGPGATVGNAFLSLRRGIDGTARAASGISTAIGNVPFHVIDAGRGIENLGKKMLNLQGIVTTTNGRFLQLARGTNPDGSTYSANRFIPDPTANLSRMRAAVGKAFVITGDAVQGFGVKVAKVWAGLSGGAQSAFQFVKSHAQSILQGGLQAVVGGVSGYFFGLATDIQTQMFTGLTAAGNVAAAFASPQGAILGPLTLVSTGIGVLFGAAAKRTQQAKALAQAVATEIGSISDKFKTAFRDIGDTGSNSRITATFKTLQDLVGDATFKRAADDFGLTNERLATAAGKGAGAVRTYAQTLIAAEVSKVLTGDAKAVKSFAGEVADASKRLVGNSGVSDILLTLQQGAGQPTVAGKAAADVRDLSIAFSRNQIPFSDFIGGLKRAGVGQSILNQVTKDYKGLLASDIASSPGARYILGLSSILRDNIKQQDEYNQAQLAAQNAADNQSSIATRFENAYGRIKDVVDKATTALQDFFTAKSGGGSVAATARLSLADLGKQGNDAHQNLTGGALTDTLSGIYDQALQALAPVIAQIGQTSPTKGAAQVRLTGFFDAFEKNYPNLRTFIESLRKRLPTDALGLVFASAGPVKGAVDLANRFHDFLQDPKNIKIKTELDGADPQQRVKLLKKDLLDFANTDPTVHAYLSTGPKGKRNMDEAIAALKTDIASPFHDRTMTVGVKFDFSASQKLIAVKLGILDVHSGTTIPNPVVPPTRNPDTLGGNHGGGGSAPPSINPPGAPVVGGTNPFKPLFGVTGVSHSKIDNQRPTIHHETNVTQHITETVSPRLTAAEAIRQVKGAEFLGGGPLSVAAYAGA